MQEQEKLLLEHELRRTVHVIRPRMARLEDETALLFLEHELENIINESELTPPKVVLNFESVESLVTPTLAKLMSYRSRFITRGGTIVLCGLRPAVAEVMKITHFDRLMPTYATEAEAIRKIG